MLKAGPIKRNNALSAYQREVQRKRQIEINTQQVLAKKRHLAALEQEFKDLGYFVKEEKEHANLLNKRKPGRYDDTRRLRYNRIKEELNKEDEEREYQKELFLLTNPPYHSLVPFKNSYENRKDYERKVNIMKYLNENVMTGTKIRLIEAVAKELVKYEKDRSKPKRPFTIKSLSIPQLRNLIKQIIEQLDTTKHDIDYNERGDLVNEKELKRELDQEYYRLYDEIEDIVDEEDIHIPTPKEIHANPIKKKLSNKEEPLEIHANPIKKKLPNKEEPYSWFESIKNIPSTGLVKWYESIPEPKAEPSYIKDIEKLTKSFHKDYLKSEKDSDIAFEKMVDNAINEAFHKPQTKEERKARTDRIFNKIAEVNDPEESALLDEYAVGVKNRIKNRRMDDATQIEFEKVIDDTLRRQKNKQDGVGVFGPNDNLDDNLDESEIEEEEYQLPLGRKIANTARNAYKTAKTAYDYTGDIVNNAKVGLKDLMSKNPYVVDTVEQFNSLRSPNKNEFDIIHPGVAYDEPDANTMRFYEPEDIVSRRETFIPHIDYDDIKLRPYAQTHTSMADRIDNMTPERQEELQTELQRFGFLISPPSLTTNPDTEGATKYLREKKKQLREVEKEVKQQIEEKVEELISNPLSISKKINVNARPPGQSNIPKKTNINQPMLNYVTKSLQEAIMNGVTNIEKMRPKTQDEIRLKKLGEIKHPFQPYTEEDIEKIMKKQRVDEEKQEEARRQRQQRRIVSQKPEKVKPFETLPRKEKQHEVDMENYNDYKRKQEEEQLRIQEEKLQLELYKLQREKEIALEKVSEIIDDIRRKNPGITDDEIDEYLSIQDQLDSGSGLRLRKKTKRTTW